MGRHAAPGDDDRTVSVAEQVTIPVPDPASGPASGPAASPVPAPVFAPLSKPVDPDRPPGSRPLPGPRGRHAHPDDEDDDAIVEAAPVRREGATAADLRLLRSEPALRNRVIAAVVVPFALYAVVLVVIGRMDAFAVWVWLPLIGAGIGAGLLLDAAHAKQKKAGG